MGVTQGGGLCGLALGYYLAAPAGRRTGEIAAWKNQPAVPESPSATLTMQNYVLSLCLIASQSAGCAHQNEQPSAPAASAVAGAGTLRTLAAPAVVTNQLITTFGQYLVGGVWKVRVSREDRTVEVGLDVASSKPSGWRAQDGWFVFVENDRRVWMYDGDRGFLLYEFTRSPTGGAGSWSGPTKFDCPVPEAVLTRLSDTARNAIKRND